MLSTNSIALGTPGMSSASAAHNTSSYQPEGLVVVGGSNPLAWHLLFRIQGIFAEAACKQPSARESGGYAVAPTSVAPTVPSAILRHTLCRAVNVWAPQDCPLLQLLAERACSGGSGGRG